MENNNNNRGGRRGSFRGGRFRGRWNYRGRGRGQNTGRGNANNSNGNRRQQQQQFLKHESSDDGAGQSRDRRANSDEKSNRHHLEMDDSSNDGDNHNNKHNNTPTSRRQSKYSKKYVEKLDKKYVGFVRYFPYPCLPGFENFEIKCDSAMEFLNIKLEKEGKKKKVEILQQIYNRGYLDVVYTDLVREDNTQIEYTDSEGTDSPNMKGETLYLENWNEFDKDLENFPEDVFKTFGLALFQIMYEWGMKREEPTHDDDSAKIKVDSHVLPSDMPYFRVGILKVDPITPIHNIIFGDDMTGKFVTIRGCVVRTGSSRFLCTQMTFSCSECSEQFHVPQFDGKYTVPKKCGATNCTNKKKDSFEAFPSSRHVRGINFQKITIQDVEQSQNEPGKVPRNIECHLFRDLVDTCTVGENVTLCGVVTMNHEIQMHSTALKPFLKVASMKNHRESDRTLGGNWFCFTNKDYYLIKEIYECKDLFPLLVASLVPGIYGHEYVKAALLLTMFGGTSTEDENEDENFMRPDMHTLIVGDPGLGKSQMLKKVSEVAPRGVYVCGTGTTTAGLTVTLSKNGNEHTVDAGALVLADRGVCCIDEFDKMHSQHNSLLEVMEQQCVSITKAGIYRTIPARASVVAAANPIGGHYDKTQSVAKNIHMSPALLSRFDIIFILQDTPNSATDRRLISHITGFKRKRSNSNDESKLEEGTLLKYLKAEYNYDDQEMDHYDEENNDTVPQNHYKKAEKRERIPPEYFRKYIAYAKMYVHPKMSTEAGEIIKKYYLDLRKNYRRVDSTPVTIRQLESLIRLSQARAKTELRETVTKQDAEDVIEIFKTSMNGVFDDDIVTGLTQEILNRSNITMNGSIINDPNSPGLSRMSKKKQAKGLYHALVQVADRQCKSIFTVNEIQVVAGRLQLTNSQTLELIDGLNNEGLLLKTGGSVYKVKGTTF